MVCGSLVSSSLDFMSFDCRDPVGERHGSAVITGNEPGCFRASANNRLSGDIKSLDGIVESAKCTPVDNSFGDTASLSLCSVVNTFKSTRVLERKYWVCRDRVRIKSFSWFIRQVRYLDVYINI